jgi:transcriptional regulator with XRE-family HTH domain|tara:strand:+ start:201 stop:557 length:357 start_codon:yes stop_codon:yes gene_type:complete
MNKDIGLKIRKLRELKGYSQEYMAERLTISQRAYSKLERNETKLDWGRITDVSSILEIEPMDLISFDDNLIFNNCHQSGKINTINNQIDERLVSLFEKRMEKMEEEVKFLREFILKQK